MLLSFCRSTHSPLLQVWPAAQTETHVPARQQLSEPQTFPQEPQLALSLSKSAHWPSGHRVRSAAQNEAHVPPEQQVPLPQVLPQAPQFALSLLKSAH